jgi:hypothetical protein
MLEAFFTLFLALFSFPTVPATDPGVSSVPVVEDPGSTTLAGSEEDARGVFDPDGLTRQTPRGGSEAPES